MNKIEHNSSVPLNNINLTSLRSKNRLYTIS